MGFATITITVLISSLFLLSETSGGDSSNSAFATSQSLQQTQQQQDNETMQIAAGGGNYSAPFTVYVPDNAEVKVGQAVNWYNPTDVGEPHTVTFVYG